MRRRSGVLTVNVIPRDRPRSQAALATPHVQQVLHFEGFHVRTDSNVHTASGLGGNAIIGKGISHCDACLKCCNVQGRNVTQLFLLQDSMGTILMQVVHSQLVTLPLSEGQCLFGEFQQLFYSCIINKATAVARGTLSRDIYPPRQAFSVKDIHRIRGRRQPFIQCQCDAWKCFVDGGIQKGRHTRSTNFFVRNKGQIDGPDGTVSIQNNLSQCLNVLHPHTFHILRPPSINLSLFPNRIKGRDRPGRGIRGDHIIMRI